MTTHEDRIKLNTLSNNELNNYEEGEEFEEIEESECNEKEDDFKHNSHNIANKEHSYSINNSNGHNNNIIEEDIYIKPNIIKSKGIAFDVKLGDKIQIDKNRNFKTEAVVPQTDKYNSNDPDLNPENLGKEAIQFFIPITNNKDNGNSSNEKLSEIFKKRKTDLINKIENRSNEALSQNRSKSTTNILELNNINKMLLNRKASKAQVENPKDISVDVNKSLLKRAPSEELLNRLIYGKQAKVLII